jgi:hypothetical protein
MLFPSVLEGSATCCVPMHETTKSARCVPRVRCLVSLLGRWAVRPEQSEEHAPRPPQHRSTVDSRGASRKRIVPLQVDKRTAQATEHSGMTGGWYQVEGRLRFTAQSRRQAVRAHGESTTQDRCIPVCSAGEGP